LVYVCVYAHTSHIAHEVLDVSPGVETRHLEGPKNPDGLSLGEYVFVYVYKVHMCTYMLGGAMRSEVTTLFLWQTCPFRKKNQKV